MTDTEYIGIVTDRVYDVAKVIANTGVGIDPVVIQDLVSGRKRRISAAMNGWSPLTVEQVKEYLTAELDRCDEIIQGLRSRQEILAKSLVEVSK